MSYPELLKLRTELRNKTTKTPQEDGKVCPVCGKKI